MTDDPVTWIPPIDVYEMDNNYILNAELPGVNRDDIKIEFVGSELVVRGERKFDTVCARENYHRLEGHRGRFHRSFSLPEPIDIKKIQIELKTGILHVVLPKCSSASQIRAKR
jgi:HSP20 family protein